MVQGVPVVHRALGSADCNRMGEKDGCLPQLIEGLCTNSNRLQDKIRLVVKSHFRYPAHSCSLLRCHANAPWADKSMKHIILVDSSRTPGLLVRLKIGPAKVTFWCALAGHYSECCG